jgi:hypothetical protein
MKPPDLTAEIAVLEEKLKHHQKLLDQAFANNLQFAETKVILHEVKKIADKLAVVKIRIPVRRYFKSYQQPFLVDSFPPVEADLSIPNIPF